MPSSSAPPLHIVLNAGSGSRDAAESRAVIEEVLRAAGRSHRIYPVEQGDQLPHLADQAVAAAQQESGAVVAAGGDGTINCVAQRVLPTGLPFGLLPQGTFNFVSRARGIPLDLREATEALLAGTPSPMQVGMLNGRIFLVNASLGLYPQLLEDRETFKREHGRYRFNAYFSAFFTLLNFRHQLHLEIQLDDRVEAIRTPTLFVGNNPLQLEKVGLPEAEAVRHGRLAVVIVRPISTAGLFWLAVRGALRHLGDSTNIRDFATRRIVVRTRSTRGRLKVATDGEVWWTTSPLEFSVAEQPLWLLCRREPESTTAL